MSGALATIWDCSIVSCEFNINPYMILHTATLKTEDTVPKLVALMMILLKALEETNDTNIHHEIMSLP